MTFPIITALLAAGLIILQQILMLNVGMHRTKTLIGVGIGGDQQLERKVRQHGNLAENAAIFLVTLALSELYGAPTTVVMGFAIAFAVSRLSHVLGFMSLSGSHDPSRISGFVMLRAAGAFGTVFSGLGLGGYLAYLIVMRWS